MATRKLKLTGIVEWAKVFPQNRDMKGFEGAYEDCDGACTIDVVLDDDHMASLQASRSMKRGKTDLEGRGTTVRFVRKFDTGRDWDSGAPVVLKEDGTRWDYDVDGAIGNGSTADIYLSVYDTKMKNIVGTRLDKVAITNHTPYESPQVDDVLEAEVIAF
tara:strand:+ start:3657 stop:4136 length:480 start_codon:yes stop_codon:yes gene_type:complete